MPTNTNIRRTHPFSCLGLCYIIDFIPFGVSPPDVGIVCNGPLIFIYHCVLIYCIYDVWVIEFIHIDNYLKETQSYVQQMYLQKPKGCLK